MTLKKDREKKIQEMTRNAIRKAVINVMFEYDMEGVTMQRVADEAGLAKGTLYLYFDNKEDLLDDTIDWSFKPMLEGMEKIFTDNSRPDKQVAKLADFHYHFIQNHQKLFKMLLVDQQIAQSNKEKQENEHYKHILQKTSELIQAGIDKGIFRDINPMAVAIIMIESSKELNYQFLRPEPSFDFGSENPATILKGIFLKGILKS